MLKGLGFEVAKYKSKPINEYTNEELLEYWYRLRFSFLGVPEEKCKESLSWHITIDIQNEILRRMKDTKLTLGEEK